VSAVIVGGEPIARGPWFAGAVKHLVERLADEVRRVREPRAQAG
jgi:hypothetical protein